MNSEFWQLERQLLTELWKHVVYQSEESYEILLSRCFIQIQSIPTDCYSISADVVLSSVFHIREIRSSDSKQISTVEHSQNDGTQSDVGYRSFEQQNQRMGLLYRLYCTGWRNGSLRFLPTLQHWVLNIFLDYRKGYAEGAKWRQQHL